MAIEFVELETARAARGVRLVVLGMVPSPWSEAAKAIFHVKGIDAVATRYRIGDDAVKGWTGIHNAPVVMFDDEPPRSHWSDILALAERLGGQVSLLPADANARLLVWGLSHEIVGEGGLLWAGRLLMLHDSIESGGQRGFPPPVAKYLGNKYGYDPAAVTSARARCGEVIDLLLRTLGESRKRGSRYLVGDALTAADLYMAVAWHPFRPFDEARCPLLPMLRNAFESLDPSLAPEVPAALLEHRDFVYERHLELPIRL